MISANHELARRLEGAEGFACLEFAVARKRLFPACDSAWMQTAGTVAVFDGPGAPTTQTFGLGIAVEPDAAVLEEIEQFFFARGAAVMHEVSPHAGAATLDRLCARGYRPLEISNVLYRQVGSQDGMDGFPVGESRVQVRVIAAAEGPLWSEVNAQGWTHEHPEFREFLERTGAILTERALSPCFLAELDGVPGAAAALCLHEGVALFAGAATVPALRRRGLQRALLAARLRYAVDQGCDLAMIVTEAGSESQRNAERMGFRVAYTRIKWMLAKS